MFLAFNHRISLFYRNPNFLKFNFYAPMSSPSATKIIAEYAKSGKSSCKKCSEKIDSKSLRLGLKIKDPRGYDNTKWHHFHCFFSMDSVSVPEVESIEGFSQLTESDQDKLKKIVSEGDQPDTKTDEDEESAHEKNVTNEKIVVEYAKSGRSSCKKCPEKIESKSIRLGYSSWDPRGFENTKWYHLDCFFPFDADLVSVELIEGFSELKSSDQEKLKKLVIEGDKSSKKREGDETESDRGDMKKLKTDEEDGGESGQDKKKATNKKIVVEYAKSGRSSCKKCSEKIETKSIRLGYSSWDPRGFENTKWHHLDCFFPLDADPVSAESIDGYSKLKGSDQEKLKKLVTEGGQSSKKSNEDDEMELQGRDEKIEKKSDSHNKDVGLEVAFAAGDVMANYKDATLPPKWRAYRTIIYNDRDEGLHDSNKIAAFDFDGCLAKTSVQRVGAKAWSLMYASIPKKLQSLYNDGYKLVIFTNEANIERWKNKRQAAVDSKIGRLNSFIKLVEVPVQVFIACGVSKGKEEDPFRKPQTGMWRIMQQQFNSGIEIDMDQYLGGNYEIVGVSEEYASVKRVNESFYVGDAAGRIDDHSDADKKFAEAIGLKFHLPEDYFDA